MRRHLRIESKVRHSCIITMIVIITVMLISYMVVNYLLPERINLLPIGMASIETQEVVLPDNLDQSMEEDQHCYNETIISSGLQSEWNELLSSGEMREISCSEVQFGSNIANEDFVDLRIRFPNGEDYAVLTRQQIHLIEENNERQIYFCLSEKELQFLSSAAFDMNHIEGSYLYLVKYVSEYGNRTTTLYTPKISTIQLLLTYSMITEKEAQQMLQFRNYMDERICVQNQSAQYGKEDDIEETVEETVKEEYWLYE
jgi:predicted small secreted protein